MASGGLASGGAPSGGAASGGASSGGASSGGASSGGATSGGSSSGGGGGSSNGSGGANGGGSGNGSGGTSGSGGGSSNGGASGSGSGGGGGSGSGGSSTTGFQLTSPNHAEGATFASKYTCSDKGFSGSVMPALNWTDGPTNTKSYALTFIDTTLAGQNDIKGYHWVIWNIPATVKSLPEALTDAQAKALPAKENSAFLGPCPNFGSAPPTGAKTDVYEFTLYALATETVDITGSNIVQAAVAKLDGSNLAKAKLSGKSNAANNK
ncbi:MAG: YbhB/YbcL family Raf kinase inhibitor-like protein [Polyangiaceae bacterium]